MLVPNPVSPQAIPDLIAGQLVSLVTQAEALLGKVTDKLKDYTVDSLVSPTSDEVGGVKGVEFPKYFSRLNCDLAALEYFLSQIERRVDSSCL